MKPDYKSIKNEIQKVDAELESARVEVKEKRAKITKEHNAKLTKLHAKKNTLNAQLDELLLPVHDFMETLGKETSHYAEADKRKLSDSVLKSHLAKLDIEMSVGDFEDWARDYKERLAPKQKAKKPAAKAEDAPPANAEKEQQKEQASFGAQFRNAGANSFAAKAPQTQNPHASERV